MRRGRQRRDGGIVTTYLEAWLTVPRAMTEKSWRLAAPEFERAVAIATQHVLSDRAGMLETLERSGLQSPDIRTTIESTSAFSRRLENEADSRDCLVELLDRIELCDDGVRVTLKIRVPCSRAGVQTNSILDMSRFVPLKMKRRGVETRIWS